MKQTTFAETLDAADILSEKGISARVIDMAIVKPLDKSAMLSTAKDCGKIVTCEEHSIIGGLGETVCAVIAEHGLACPVKRVGVNDEFGHSGPLGSCSSSLSCVQLIWQRLQMRFDIAKSVYTHQG